MNLNEDLFFKEHHDFWDGICWYHRKRVRVLFAGQKGGTVSKSLRNPVLNSRYKLRNVTTTKNRKARLHTGDFYCLRIDLISELEAAAQIGLSPTKM